MYVTVFVSDVCVPRWQAHLVHELSLSEGIRLDIATWNGSTRQPEGRSRLFRLWSRFDERAFRNKRPENSDGEAIVNLGEQATNQKLRQYGSSTVDVVVEELSGKMPDLFVWLIPGRPPEPLVSAARVAVWGISNAFNPAFGFTELVDFEVVTACDIIGYGPSEDKDYLVARSYAATDQLSLSRGMIGIRAKCSALLLRCVRRLRRSGLEETEPQCHVRLECRFPSLPKMVWGLFRLYGRYVVDVFARRFFQYQWQLAYRSGGDRLSQKDLKRLRPSHGGFWADPFVISQDDRVYIFFEEMPENAMRGHICALELFADGSEGEPVCVLRREHHLSYPFLFRYLDELYMLPEAAESGRIEVYRCNRFPDQWEPVQTILEGVKAYDPTLVYFGDMWWMFVTIQHDGNSCDDELHLYYAKSPFDEWMPHPLNPVQLDVRAARPAGALFRKNGKLFRPAQNCSRRYGWAISIQEIKKMTINEFEEVTVKEVYPEWAGHARATHTVNQSAGITIYDCEARCRKGMLSQRLKR